MQDAAFWDRTAPRYAKSPIKNVAAYEATLDRVRGNLKATDRVLEIGCGTGSTALKLAGSVSTYVATDLSEGMISIARQKAASAGVPNLEFQVARAREAGDGSFDAVLGFSILHLLRDLDGGIARAHQALKPGGLFITKTPCLKDMSFLLRLLIPAMRLVRLAPFVQIFSWRELEQRIEAGGFEIVESATFAGAANARFLVAKKA